MHGLICDRCGGELLVEEDVRYVMEVRIHAAYDPLELTREDLARDFASEYQRLLASAEKRDERELSEEVFYRREFDLCGSCRKAMLEDPLGKEREEP